MPRIPPTLLRHARRIDPLLPPLLPVCRDLQSCRNELRWLDEHAAEVVSSKQPRGNQQHLLRQYVNRRAKGEPLQYILGTEFFGHLEIKCRPEVLIPRSVVFIAFVHALHLISVVRRQETAASVSHLASLLSQSWKQSPAEHPVSILDLCTGTGCIPLLLHHELFSHSDVNPNVARLAGVDISSKALRLAEENKSIQLREQATTRNSASQRIATLREIQFLQADLLADEDEPSSVVNALLEMEGRPQPKLDYEIVISNPPYISSSAFRRTTASSVRKFEPKLALVPPQTDSPPMPYSETPLDDGDIFYPKLFEICDMLDTKVVLFEVADMEQACRVAAMAVGRWREVEIWRDDPGARTEEEKYMRVGWKGLQKIRVVGRGNGRSVVAWRGEGCRWMSR